MRRAAEALALEDPTTCFLASSQLTGSAVSWFEEWRKANPAFTFDNLAAAITARFARAPETDPRERMLDLGVRGNDLSGYCQGFSQLAAQCVPPMDMATQVAMFVKGLPQQLQPRVKFAKPVEGWADLAAVQQAAMTAHAVGKGRAESGGGSGRAQAGLVQGWFWLWGFFKPAREEEVQDQQPGWWWWSFWLWFWLGLH